VFAPHPAFAKSPTRQSRFGDGAASAGMHVDQGMFSARKQGQICRKGHKFRRRMSRPGRDLRTGGKILEDSRWTLTRPVRSN
jgi:hypothetical protein